MDTQVTLSKNGKAPRAAFTEAACLHAGRLIRVATLEARRCTADGEVLVECYILADYDAVSLIT